MTFVRYTSSDEDSARWHGFPFRAGDVVVSSRSKHGTTWVQTILLLLIHRRPELPESLPALSPWLDHLVEPREVVLARLQAQPHRRVIKTHTPLDGLPADDRAIYVVIARHPLDAAVSLYHQGDNLDRARLARLTGADSPTTPRPPLPQWLADWVARNADPVQALDSLAGVLGHLTDAWQRRHQANVVLVHYHDLILDLPGEMHRLAELLGLEAPDSDLVRAATFDEMRRRGEWLAPDPVGILRDRQAFFRRGESGAAVNLLTPDELDGYYRRAAMYAPPDLLAWLHRG